MDNSIYEVERDDYVGFVGQLNKEKCEVEEYFYQDITFYKIKSKATGTHFCTRMILPDGDEHYFVFNMPEIDERIAPKAIMKVTLDDKNEVQTFFNAINKLQLEANMQEGN